MAPALEVVFIKPTEAYIQDPSAINPMLELVAPCKGCLGIYHGIKIEQPDILVLLIVWDKLSDHHEVMADTVNYPKVGEAFARVGDLSTLDMFHVHLDCDLAGVLNARVVSYGNIRKLKPGVDPAEFLKLFQILTDRETPEGCRVGGYARAVERDEFLLLYGWDDIKFSQASREDEEVKTAMKKVHEAFEQADRGHVQLITYKKYEP
ncbi:hypothetical protein PsYK624_155950 [Phanerochaete sordida]|uniref:ABM domain-containing protein n=1 Tax=Phanerochaete sordida TaxID=48140 RepID=A0A9P3LLA0_9APHY|nr:hypothetical protein PsYK624_155950 [Phanerochaete sordida]